MFGLSKININILSVLKFLNNLACYLGTFRVAALLKKYFFKNMQVWIYCSIKKNCVKKHVAEWNWIVKILLKIKRSWIRTYLGQHIGHFSIQLNMQAIGKTHTRNIVRGLAVTHTNSHIHTHIHTFTHTYTYISLVLVLKLLYNSKCCAKN